MSNETNTFYPEGKEVKIKDKVFKVKPFVLKNRIIFVRIISEVWEGGITVTVHKIIEKAGEKLVDIYALVLEGAEKEWMENNITMKDEINIINAIMEVNDIPFVISQIQEMVNKPVK